MKALVLFLLGIVEMFYRGLVLKQVWSWFVETQFKGVPHLSLLGAIGLGYVASIFIGPDYSFEELRASSEERTAFRLVQMFHYVAWLSVAWLFAYLLHLFM